MKKFEIGKTYSDGEGIEIEVIKRTDKTVTFRFSKPNWFETDMYSEFRKKVSFESLEYEIIHLGSHWAAPRITATEE